ncbi:aldehyde dehydrogenase [Chlorobium sp. KB01]|uniref:aldehyde dehydrogenase family protein n=1 Tax=Chlorobium sp. KB01 TaxID=1917528 RepID=UPI000975B16B|nr:aldehyde dehydrogenase family protein [Chlorobium sp. KB01]
MKTIPNWINGQEALPEKGNWLDKFNPHTGLPMSRGADSTSVDTHRAIDAAGKAFPVWSSMTPVRRGQILADMVTLMKQNSAELAECIAVETGKPPHDAVGEVNGAILQAEFFAGEGMRLYGRTLTSAMPGKQSFTVRQPRGIAGLIVPANTPIANIAWKTFPALICGNTVVMKAAEDAPEIAHIFARLTKESGIPDGVFNVIQGRGLPAGAAIVEDGRVAIISFTGSTGVGRWIAEVAGRRLARVSLELGGKNPFVVCDDADLERAVHWASLSAFSNAGQRCAAGSRILVFRQIYDEFKNAFISRASGLKLGVTTDCDLGPVINQRQHRNVLTAINGAVADGGIVLCGGKVPVDTALANGYYIQPTVIDGLRAEADLSCQELFGPVVTLHPVDGIREALKLANTTEYGLTAAIHTQNLDRAMYFAQNVRAGVANINIGTFGSEPHMPFGGFGASGNGSREPGIEALDVYSELKNISVLTQGGMY